MISSTSIMANMPFAAYAVEQALKFEISCVGLHVNLTAGKPILENKNLTDENGVFLYNRKQIDDNPNLTYADAYNEIKAQIAWVELQSRGKLKLDHLNGHHLLTDNKIISKAIHDVAKERNLPVRHESYARGLKSPDVFYMGFSIVGVSLENLQQMIEKYRKTNLVVEILTHCGYVDQQTKLMTSYLNREKELRVLQEAKRAGVFDGIEIINFQKL